MIDAYEALKNRAASGRYVLADIKAKVNTLWVEGDLTDAQRAELIALADTNYDPAYSPLSPTEQALAARVTTLEEQLAQIAQA